MSDIVKRLRLCSPYSEDGTTNSNMQLVHDAADEIERLWAVVESVQWCETNAIGESRCPSCTAMKFMGHHDGCDLAAALAAKGEGKA